MSDSVAIYLVVIAAVISATLRWGRRACAWSGPRLVSRAMTQASDALGLSCNQIIVGAVMIAVTLLLWFMHDDDDAPKCPPLPPPPSSPSSPPRFHFRSLSGNRSATKKSTRSCDDG